MDNYNSFFDTQHQITKSGNVNIVLVKPFKTNGDVNFDMNFALQNIVTMFSLSLTYFSNCF